MSVISGQMLNIWAMGDSPEITPQMQVMLGFQLSSGGL